MHGDVINGLFELLGSVFLWLNVIRLRRDKEAKGIDWRSVLFFFSWGVWNLHYYPSLGQWWSFCGGISIAIANAAWIVLLWWYAGRKSGK